MKQFAVLIIIVFVFLSCTKQDNSNSNALAIYKGDELSWNEVKTSFPKGLSENDSVRLLNSIVENWAISQILYENAEQNLNTDQFNIEQMVKEYRKELIIHHYKRKLVEEKLDSVVNQEDVEEFYSKHANEFRLRENIIRFYFVKVPLSVPNAYMVSRWMRYVDDEDKLNQLKEFSYQNARYYEFDSTWNKFSRIENLFQPDIQSQEDFLKSNKIYQKQDSLYYYFLYIDEFLLKGDIAPMEYIYSELKQVIISKRKIKFFNQLENRIRTEAKNNKQLKINI